MCPTLLTVFLAGFSLPPTPHLEAQASEIRGYALNVAAGTNSGPFTSSNVSDTQIIRLMAAPAIGPVELELAHEQFLSLTVGESMPSRSDDFATPRSGTEWLDLQGTIASSDRAVWRHRVDRLSAHFELGSAADLTVGRQPISWATTLILTPADPFVPFNAEDPFREYRTGVDAARLRVFPGPFSSLDAVLRVAKVDGEDIVTGLARAHAVVAGWEVGGWAGYVHEEASVSLALTRTFAGTAGRAEFVVRDQEESIVSRLALGLDRSFSVFGRDLYAVLEYQRDELGAGDASQFASVLSSRPFRRGELIVLGRNTAALQTTYSIHTLWSTTLLLLSNLDDPSLLLAPGLGYSVSDEIVARGGLFLGLGRNETSAGTPGSEFGPVPTVAWISAAVFF
ncbi:MAG: hypothetical protein ABFS14_00625 [Gemmatimonadota bacterium]